MPTISTFHSHFFLLLSPFPLYLLKTHTHCPPLPPHTSTASATKVSPLLEKKKPMQVESVYMFVLLKWGLVYPATINYTIYRGVTQPSRAPCRGSQRWSLEIPIIFHQVWFILIWERGGQSHRTLTFKDILALTKPLWTPCCLGGGLHTPSMGSGRNKNNLRDQQGAQATTPGSRILAWEAGHISRPGHVTVLFHFVF